jgi:hypothetical protein
MTKRSATHFIIIVVSRRNRHAKATFPLVSFGPHGPRTTIKNHYSEA